MLNQLHNRVLTLCLLCLSLTLSAQDQSAGLFMSPKGFGLTIQWGLPRGEMRVLTLRNDLYGILSGRTTLQGASLCYTHEYFLFTRTEEDLRLRIHAGAGALLGYVQDFEKGFFSAYNRALMRGPGAVAALAGRFGVQVDFFWNRLSLDLSITAAPGIHLRSNRDSGAMILSFYRNGILRAYSPELNLLYNF